MGHMIFWLAIGTLLVLALRKKNQQCEYLRHTVERLEDELRAERRKI